MQNKFYERGIESLIQKRNRKFPHYKKLWKMNVQYLHNYIKNLKNNLLY